ncbi:MAG: CD1871A family CXXC motif-containing protein [Butyricicoccus sp.]
MQQRNKKFIAPLLLMLSAVMMIYGAWNGEAAIVLRKATKICLECIGIG